MVVYPKGITFLRTGPLTLFLKPSKGTGTPHLRSLVIHRGFKPSLNQDWAITSALWVQPGLDSFIQWRNNGSS